MSEYGKAISNDTYRIERLLPGPVERIWAYLTESEKRKQWFAAGDMPLQVGGVVNFWFQHSNLAPPDEAVPEEFKLPNEGMASTATITRVEPLRILAFRWGAGEVIIELESKGSQVLLTLTHRKLPNREEMKDIADGWHLHLDVLEDRLCGRGRQPFWTKLDRLKHEYDQRLSSTFKLVVSRRFKASAERVYDAFLDPAKAGYFMFATPAGKMVRADVDPRVGGKFLFIDRRGDQDADHGGEYVELTRPKRIVFDLRVPASSQEPDRVEIDIVPTGDGCELTLTHHMKTQWIDMRDKAVAGWSMILESAERTITQHPV